MKQTLFVRLDSDKEQLEALLDTMEVFNAACNFIASTVHRLRTANKTKLRKHVYRSQRKIWALSPDGYPCNSEGVPSLQMRQV